MTKVSNVLKIVDSKAGLSHEFKINDAYMNFGAQIEITTTRNPGTDKEKVLPVSYRNESINIQGSTRTQEEYDELIKTNPIFKEFIEKVFALASEPYKD